MISRIVRSSKYLLDGTTQDSTKNCCGGDNDLHIPLYQLVESEIPAEKTHDFIKLSFSIKKEKIVKILQ